MDGSLQGIAVFAAGDFRPRFVNEAMLRLTGVKAAAEYVGTVRLFDNIAEPYLKSLRERIGHLLAGDCEHVEDELPVRRPDGTLYWAEFHARRVEWDGAPAVQLTVLDVTDRKRAEEALKDRQAVLTRQNEYFRQDISRRRERAEKGLVAESPAMRRVLREAELVARSRVSVLIEGETGSGKDVVMPRLGGREVMTRIREKAPAARILFSTGYMAHAIDADFLKAHGLAVVEKPYSPYKVFRAVRDVLDGAPD